MLRPRTVGVRIARRSRLFECLTCRHASSSAVRVRARVQKPLNLWQISLAGAYAGLMNSVIVSPVELVKTRLQIQHEQMSLLSGVHMRPATTVPHDPSLVFNGPLDCVMKILKQNGVKGLFRYSVDSCECLFV
jgi:hypothetical protein